MELDTGTLDTRAPLDQGQQRMVDAMDEFLKIASINDQLHEFDYDRIPEKKRM